jgi:hypothetical protein
MYHIPEPDSGKQKQKPDDKIRIMAGTFRELRRLVLEKSTEQIHEATDIKIGPFHKSNLAIIITTNIKLSRPEAAVTQAAASAGFSF